MITTKMKSERATIIDAIRGFSLLGILLANMLIFQYGMFGEEKLALFPLATKLDLFLHQCLTVFVKGSFMPIFMFLFGFGLYKLRESLIRKGYKPWRSLVRRFLMLAAIGLLHGYLLWEGDILMAYGVVSFGLLLFLKRKPRTLVIWAVVLALLIAALSYGGSNDLFGDNAKINDYVARSIEIYGQGSYSDILSFRNNEFPIDIAGGLAVVILLLTPLMLAPMFLFGIAAANKGWFENPYSERRRYRLLALILAPQGILFKGFGVWQEGSGFAGVAGTLGSILLALAYIFTAAYIFSFLTRKSVMFKAFEAVGRMSLTNYLMQTVICTTVFYGYGFGLFGKIGILAGILLAILIYAAQAAASMWLLKRFKQGPVERMLRMWTYFSLGGRIRIKGRQNLNTYTVAEDHALN
ncbi:DUF418 domain-containing protein [Paenibacillus sp. IITD108]